MQPMTEQPKAFDQTVTYSDYSVSMPSTVPLAGEVTVIQNQPASTTFVQVIQTSVNYPRGIPRNWSTPLMGCFEDIGGCALGLFCFKCYECHVATKLGESCCAPVCVPNATLTMRAYVRGRHNIQGTLINDCCTTCFCTPCAICQISREFDNMEKGKIAP